MNAITRMLMARGYCDEAGGAGDDGGGSGPDMGELQKQLEALAAEKEALLAKNNELLGESKKAKEARRQAEAAAAEEARKKAEADGNHEQLYKSAMAELERERKEHLSLRETVGNEKRNNAALKLAAEMADGANAEILSEFISKRLKYTDEGVKVTDESGNLTVSTLQDLANEFKGSAKYASLLKGNQSSGGSANGGDQSGGSAPTIPRSEFDAMNPSQQREFLKGGGKPIDV